MRSTFAFVLLVLAVDTLHADQSDDLNVPSLQFASTHMRQNHISDLIIDSSYKCEPLNTEILPLCKDIAYNETRFPNFMKQKTQQEAAVDTNIYLPLIRINCSPVLKLFLCSIYAPPCVKNYSSALRPCRELCEKAKTGCEDFMKRFALAWPDYIECNRFPPFNGPEACITDDNYSNQYSFISQQHSSKQTYQSSPFALQPSQPSSNNKIDSNFLTSLTPQQQQILLNSLTSVSSLPSSLDLQNKNYVQLYAAAIAAAAAAAAAASQPGGLSSLAITSAPRIKFVCPPALQLLTDTKNTYYLNVQDDVVNNCAMPCDNNFFDRAEIEFARSWVLIWSSLCFSSTLFTILTFIIETGRFR
jgi:hypothetical protein